MVPDLAGRFYPSSATTSTTITVSNYGRSNEGVGAFAYQPAGYPPVLSIVFPNGRTDGMPWSEIVDLIVNHVLSNLPADSFSPREGTRDFALRRALSAFLPVNNGGAMGVALHWDGQFGSVYVG